MKRVRTAASPSWEVLPWRTNLESAATTCHNVLRTRRPLGSRIRMVWDKRSVPYRLWSQVQLDPLIIKEVNVNTSLTHLRSFHGKALNVYQTT
eukprot:CCRYP_008356-RA/>CCRYP_008356-RA protein AED:0.40 eAED:0.40 QI:0/0.8/0.66/1/0/0/6/695/92